MDPTTLVTPPVMGLGAAAAVLGLILGYFFGRSGEARRKEEALARAADEARMKLEKQRKELKTRLEATFKAHAAELEKLRAEHREQLAQLSRAQQELVNSLKESHAAEMQQLEGEHAQLIEKLNAENNASLQSLKETHEKQLREISDNFTRLVGELEEKRKAEILELKGETNQTIATLREEQRAALEAVRSEQERERREHQQAQEALKRELEQARRDHEAAMNALAEEKERELSVLKADRDTLAGRVEELERALTQKEQEIREARLRNMFSVSRSGEKLIKVVRSVQELATELDETSRAVTDGEYSFFEQIKDQRDRETVLSLAAGASLPEVEGAEEAQREVEEEAPSGEAASGIAHEETDGEAPREGEDDGDRKED